MDLKLKLEEEILFSKKPHSNQTIANLNKKGIFTIDDFINSDVEQIASSVERRKQFRAFQGILKYKYLGAPLVLSVLLEREYCDEAEIDNNLRHDMMKLGFGDYYFNFSGKEILSTNGSCKIMDVIESLNNKKFGYLKDFYIEYYNTQMKKEESEENMVCNEKNILDSLKNELVILLTQRTELDSKISSLLKQINILEGRKNINGRK